MTFIDEIIKELIRDFRFNNRGEGILTDFWKARESELSELLTKALEKQEEHLLNKHNGVSAWEEEGRRKGYWGYFEKLVKENIEKTQS